MSCLWLFAINCKTINKLIVIILSRLKSTLSVNSFIQYIYFFCPVLIWDPGCLFAMNWRLRPSTLNFNCKSRVWLMRYIADQYFHLCFEKAFTLSQIKVDVIEGFHVLSTARHSSLMSFFNLLWRWLHIYYIQLCFSRHCSFFILLLHNYDVL